MSIYMALLQQILRGAYYEWHTATTKYFTYRQSHIPHNLIVIMSSDRNRPKC